MVTGFALKSGKTAYQHCLTTGRNTAFDVFKFLYKREIKIFVEVGMV